MGYVTTHVLDTARGRPAAQLSLTLYHIQTSADGSETRARIAAAQTNADGRCDAPILPQDKFALGVYELVFDAGGYLRASGLPDDFLSLVTVRFTLREDAHYHVPLLLSPFGYSTYRGS